MPEPASAGAVAEPRRLVLLLDGTWNKRQDSTNVWRMRALLRHGPRQRVYYDEGVGTAKGEVFRGGVFGSGLSAKVLNAYLWLMEQYEDATESETGLADEIFVFGFSRGAFTARSLVGLLSIAGLLRRDAPTRIVDAVELTQLDGLAEDSPIARDFRRRFGRTVEVRFMGVWDTVGALGVPKVPGVPSFEFWGLEKNGYHKVEVLPRIVKHARHAVALDEHRYVFDATLWPDGRHAQSMEQRWFMGAHANVGGGYGDDALFLRPLQWLQHESIQYGLKFRQIIGALGDTFYASGPRDSLGDIFYGAYKLTQWLRPHVRPVAFGTGANQCVDYTVLERWIWHPLYAPKPLLPFLPSKPRRRPPSARLSDAQIQELMNLPAAAVFASRGFVL